MILAIFTLFVQLLPVMIAVALASYVCWELNKGGSR